MKSSVVIDSVNKVVKKHFKERRTFLQELVSLLVVGGKRIGVIYAPGLVHYDTKNKRIEKELILGQYATHLGTETQLSFFKSLLSAAHLLNVPCSNLAETHAIFAMLREMGYEVLPEVILPDLKRENILIQKKKNTINLVDWDMLVRVPITLVPFLIALEYSPTPGDFRDSLEIQLNYVTEVTGDLLAERTFEEVVEIQVKLLRNILKGGALRKLGEV